MELNILYLYPELMSLYGDYANLSVLSRHLEAMDVTVTIKKCTCEDIPDFTHADLIYMGAGTERSQKAALTYLLPHAEALKAAAEHGTLVLFTGNSMELLGTSITDINGTAWEGLAIGAFSTKETDKRTPEDVIAVSNLFDTPVVGFMNKCSVTCGVETPLFSSLTLGYGNESAHGAEGFVNGNILATHITGPVLVKNPAFTDLVIRRLFEIKNWVLPDALPVLPHEHEAYEVTLQELNTRVK